LFSSSYNLFGRALALLASAGPLFCGLAHAQAAMADTPPIAYVVLGENGAPIARALTPDTVCPDILFDTHKVRMDIRAKAETVPLRPTISAPEDSKPSAFPLLTCEKAIPRNVKHVSIGGLPLPLPPAKIHRIVVIGDTGCRLKKGDKAYQDCNDGERYPFARIAASARDWKPDIVVHVGDLLYRENACPEGDTGCAGSPWGYGWDAWQDDFFRPAAALLQAAPWVMVRGNHESCERAGQGWWRMLDPGPLRPHQDCNNAADDDVGDYSDPYAVPLGDGAQLIVLDTSNTPPNGVIPQGDIRQARYRDLYYKLEKLSRRAAYNIATNHHPILGFGAKLNKRGVATLQPGNQGIQSVFGAINPLIMPPRINAMLSGHVHLWEQVSFSSPHPTQFVAGFSGTYEDPVPLPAELPADAAPAVGAVVEHFSSWVQGFGFMTLERKGRSQWDVKVWDVNGKQVNACSVKGRHSVCEFGQVN
jgi:hypothetical protein